MPICQIKIVEGRSADTKRRLIESVSRAMAESLALKIDNVRVLVEEVPADCWGRGGRAVADLRSEARSAEPALAHATAKLLSN